MHGHCLRVFRRVAAGAYCAQLVEGRGCIPALRRKLSSGSMEVREYVCMVLLVLCTYGYVANVLEAHVGRGLFSLMRDVRAESVREGERFT